MPPGSRDKISPGNNTFERSNNLRLCPWPVNWKALKMENRDYADFRHTRAMADLAKPHPPDWPM